MGKIGVKKTTTEFVEESVSKHGGKYDYSKVEYINYATKVCIICPEHGEFWQRPQDHLKTKGCRLCGIKGRAKNRSIYELKKKFEGLIQPEEYKLIPLPSGHLVMVDNEDFDRVKNINWRGASTNGKYADNPVYGRMSRYLINCSEGMVVDHINGNPLDNRRSNLRICTQQQNLLNKSSSNGSSKYKGVRYNNCSWSARLIYKGLEYNLGKYSAEEEAGRAYDKKAKELFGEFAYLNFKD